MSLPIIVNGSFKSSTKCVKNSIILFFLSLHLDLGRVARVIIRTPITNESEASTEEPKEPVSENAATVSGNEKTDKTVSENVADKTEKPADRTLTYPEEDKTFTTAVGKYNVSVDVPAKSFTEEVTLKGSEQSWSDLAADVQNQLKEQGVSEDNSKSLDLHFENAKGEEVEPANKVSVKFTIKDKEILKDAASSDDGQVTVYHAEETKDTDGKVESINVKPVASTTDKSIVVHNEKTATAEFETDSFSDYIITGSASRHGLYLKLSHPHVDVKLVYWDYSNGQIQNLGSQIIPAKDSAEVDNIKVDNSQSGNHTPNYVVTFYKPAEGYVVTGATQDVSSNIDSNGDPRPNAGGRYNGILNFYNNDGSFNDGNKWNGFGFQGNGNIRQDQGQGYDFYQGYTLSNENFGGTITLYTSPISLEVNAEAHDANGNPVTDVKAGDTINFPITLDPHLADQVTVSAIENITVTINGKDYSISANDVVEQQDGKYTFTINNYEVTSQDIIKGKVQLDVSARFKYNSIFHTDDQFSGTNEHESSGSSSASTEISVPISEFTNLEVSKAVTGNEYAKNLAKKIYGGIDGSSYKKYFTFNITASDASNNPLNGTYTKYDYKKNTSTDDQPSQTTITFANGYASFELSDDERTILQLPTGSSYTISEDSLSESEPYRFVQIHTSDEHKGTEGALTSTSTIEDTLINDQIIDYTNKLVSGDLKFTKYGEQKDGSQAEKLDGAGFKLYKDQDCQTFIDDSTDLSNKDDPNKENDPGALGFVNIPVGTYYMKETVAPDDYELDPTVYTVKIRENNADGASASTIEDSTGKVVSEITDKLIRKNIVIKKIDSKTKAALVGAKFTLTNGSSIHAKSGLDENGEFEVNDNGKATITGLPTGTYTLTEIKAPSGYVILTTPSTIEVTKDGVNYKGQPLTTDADGNYVITVENTAGTALPNTGGTGTRTFAILGILLLASAGALITLKKKSIL